MFKRLEIKDLGPIEHASIDLGGVVVITGPNGSGKSTIANALSMISFKDTGRVKHKKNWYQMIRQGADKAVITGYASRPHVLTIGSKGPKGRTDEATEVDRLQMTYPWASLDVKAALWRAQIDAGGLSEADMRSELVGLPEEAVQAALARRERTLEDTLRNLEEWRLEVHRSKRPLPERPNPVAEVDGEPCNLEEYLPHLGHYKDQADDLYVDTKGYANTDPETLETWARFEAAYKLPLDEGWVQKAAHETQGVVNALWLGVSKATDTWLAALKGEPCSKCGQEVKRDATKEQHALEDARADYEQQPALQRLADLRKAEGMVRQIKWHREDQGRYATTQKLYRFVDLLEHYQAAVQHYGSVVGRNKAQDDLYKTIDTMIKRLRSSPTTAGDDLGRLNSRLAVSCELLGLPRLVMLEDMRPMVALAGGEDLRDPFVLSDAQKAVAGLALTESIKWLKEMQDELVVDQVDWAHGGLLEGLTRFVRARKEDYDTVLVLSAKELTATSYGWGPGRHYRIQDGVIRSMEELG